MATPEERLDEAATMAEAATAIAKDWANGPARDVIPEPLSGPLPTIKKFLASKSAEIDSNAANIAAFELDLADNNSQKIIAGVSAVGLSRKYNEKPAITDTGAVGDGLTNQDDELSAILATQQSSIDLPRGRYLISAFNNLLGKFFTGSGRLVKAVAGGVSPVNTYADDCQRVTCQEYLAAWYRNVWQQTLTPNRELRVVFGIDSTTNGGAGNGVSAGFNIWELVPQGLYNRGLQGVFGTVAINLAQDGQATFQWDESYIDAYIAAAGDLYIIRPGINEPGYLKDGSTPPINSGQDYPNRRDIGDFATSLDSGLTKLRAAKPFGNTSILLMMPNSTYDTPNGRDALWYEQLRGVFIAACRKHKCAFIDTYGYMQDSSVLGGILMDQPTILDGRPIHPNDAMNSIIAGYICDLIAPEGFKYRFAKNRFISVSAADSSPNIATPPDYYAAELCHHRTLTAEGWPIDGAVTTLTTADNIMLQLHYGYLNADRGKIKARFGRKTLLGEPAGFSGVWDVITSPPASERGAIAAEAGFSQSTDRPVAISVNGNSILIEGSLTKNSPSTIALNTPLANYSGTYNIGGSGGAAAGTATVFSGSAFEQIPVRVGVDGVIYASTSSAISCNQIAISISYIRR